MTEPRTIDRSRPYELLPLAALVIGAALAVLGIMFFVYAPACFARGAPGTEIVRQAAIAEGVPAGLALAVAEQESGIDCAAPRSSAGAVGIMQVLPSTAAEVGVPRDELHTCEGSALAGVRYLKAALERAGGDHAAAAHLYFAGLNAPSDGRSAYARAVMARKARLATGE